MSDPLFKILPTTLWNGRQTELPRAPIDEQDGYMHLSAADQVRETAVKHFGDEAHLVLIRLRPEDLSGLVWEPSRGGALFPHVYGEVPLNAVVEATPLVGATAGEFAWPEDVP